MSDPFDVWRLAWSTAFERSLEFLDNAFFPPAALSPRQATHAVDLMSFPTCGRVRLDLDTMFLLEPRGSAPPAPSARPVVIVAPFAVHDSAIADFAEGHSLAEALAREGASPLALTFWKSATAEMRDFGIDAYLSDLNVAVDDLGGRVSLVGICQGGWLAAAYAARFPHKVEKLVAAAAPLDPGAAESHITRSLAQTPPEAIARALALAGGRVSGTMSSALFGANWSPEFNAEAALQGADAATAQKFDVWNARTVDLPGAYFAQTAEWIFRENRLAKGSFPALGREVGLAEIAAPIFALAASDDAVVAPRQVTAVESKCRRAKVAVRVEPGRHLSLFMGRRTLSTAWRDIARWLGDGGVGPGRRIRRAGRGETPAPARQAGRGSKPRQLPKL
jgi:poly(3-hydroxyalkanoate) synthetase